MRTRTGRFTFFQGWLTAGALCLASTSAWAAVGINIGSGNPGGDGKVAIPVTVSGGGATVAGTQNDILFDNTKVSLTSNDCRINAAIGSSQEGCDNDPQEGPCKSLNKNLVVCGASPQPSGCPADAGTNISRFRGIIVATGNTNAIPDGALYTCTFTASDPSKLPAVLTNSGARSSDPAGAALETNGGNGQIGDGGEPTTPPTTAPTTPVTTPTPQPTTPPITGVSIEITTVPSPVAAGKVDVPVNLVSRGAAVAGTQNDILFDNTKVSLTSNDCKINAAIGSNQPGCDNDPQEGACKSLNKNLVVCGASPQPSGCPAEAGTNISRFRGIIVATGNTNVIPDGALYTCSFTVADTNNLPAMLVNNGARSSDPAGAALETTGVSGTIGAEPVPTVTVTETPTQPTETPTTPPITGVSIDIAQVDEPAAAGKVDVPVSLVSRGSSVAGTQNDILFDNTKVSLTSNDCKINSAIGSSLPGCDNDPQEGPCKSLNKNLVVCGANPQPSGCPAEAGTNISRFRGIIVATGNTNVIPDGPLYTCSFTVGDLNNLPVMLLNSGARSSDPAGGALATTGVSGSIGQVGPTPTTPPVEPTLTPTSPPPPPATNTPTTVPTNSPTVKAPTATPTPTNTPKPGGQVEEDDDGCQINAHGASSRAWMLLIPAMGLLVIRRRSR